MTRQKDGTKRYATLGCKLIYVVFNSFSLLHFEVAVLFSKPLTKVELTVLDYFTTTIFAITLNGTHSSGILTTNEVIFNSDFVVNKFAFGSRNSKCVQVDEHASFYLQSIQNS
ncbi:hypothetical protein EGR_08896 [Echinococcus granulosus]|uniref:Uncharacterized protein n=1 Tax=Echinococcus granulosus TaxID=6210 RepID=W6US22_ECHGR|nr:hypothetical protein EGR_08896 [Echinococcus granulosus]EUB56234.1 hypothetical protein EGR_08896 [Echinococcus granulosus]